MAKTAEYTKRAVDNYRNKFDMYQLRIPKDSGLKERMKRIYGKDMNNIILGLIENDLERLEANSAQEQEKQLYSDYTKSETVKTEEGQPDILQNEFPVEENVCPF